MLTGVQNVLARGQANALELMVDRARVVRVQRVTNPDYTITDTEVEVWEGPCRVQTYEPDAIERDSAGRPVVTQEYRLHVPTDAGPFQIGDVAHVEGYPAPFLIDGLIMKTFQTAQRLKCTVQSNKEG